MTFASGCGSGSRSSCGSGSGAGSGSGWTCATGISTSRTVSSALPGAGRMALPEKSSLNRVMTLMASSEAMKAAETIGTILGKYGSAGVTAREKMRASTGR